MMVMAISSVRIQLFFNVNMRTGPNYSLASARMPRSLLRGASLKMENRKLKIDERGCPHEFIGTQTGGRGGGRLPIGVTQNNTEIPKPDPVSFLTRVPLT